MLDLSGSANPGLTTVRLVHQFECEQYVFVLYLHPPTAAQLKGLASWREAENAWQALKTMFQSPPTHQRQSLFAADREIALQVTSQVTRQITHLANGSTGQPSANSSTDQTIGSRFLLSTTSRHERYQAIKAQFDD